MLGMVELALAGAARSGLGRNEDARKTRFLDPRVARSQLEGRRAGAARAASPLDARGDPGPLQERTRQDVAVRGAGRPTREGPIAAEHPFPVFNMLNAYQWLLYIPLHNARHNRQIAETLKELVPMKTPVRTIVVTGGGAGIGRAVALQCAARGDRVAVLDIDGPAAQSAAAAALAAGANARRWRWNATSRGRRA
jgi:hypothetical protein